MQAAILVDDISIHFHHFISNLTNIMGHFFVQMKKIICKGYTNNKSFRKLNILNVVYREH